MLLSIIIPAHNEEERIGKTLEAYLNFFNNAEFIVVLNGCRDNTLKVVKDWQKKFPQLNYLNIKEAIGKGGALKEGFKAAKGNLIGFVDADMATSPKEYKKLIDNIEGVDGVIASRYLKGSVAKRSNFRKIISFGLYLVVKILFHLPYRDTQCGAKVFRRKVIKKILPEMKLNNMMIDVEMLVLARKYKFKIKEIPTVWLEKGKSDFLGSPFKVLKNSIILFFSLIKLRMRI